MKKDLTLASTAYSLTMKKDCEDCFKIKCRGCGWEPNDAELIAVQKGQLTACPTCGWSPSKN